MNATESTFALGTRWDTLPTKAPAKKCVSHEEKSRGFCMGHAVFAANRRLTR